jgi:hypothetical protein
MKMKKGRCQIKVTFSEGTDSETFAEIKAMFEQGTPAATAIKILLVQRRVLAAEVELLKEYLNEYQTLAKDLKVAFASQNKDLERTLGGAGRSGTGISTSPDDEVLNLMDGY